MLLPFMYEGRWYCKLVIDSLRTYIKKYQLASKFSFAKKTLGYDIISNLSY